MLPEEKARVKIDKQLSDAGWDIVARDEYVPFNASAVKEALMQGNKESDYLLFIDDKAIAVVEAKAEDNALGDVVARQAEWYSQNPQGWVGLWFPSQIPFVYLANGNKIYFKNMLDPLNGMPFVAVRGNHEFRGDETDDYVKYFGRPYGAFRIGDVLYIYLDTGEDKPLVNKPNHYTLRTDTEEHFREQGKWLKDLIKSDICKTAKRRIVLTHCTPFLFSSVYFRKQLDLITDGAFFGENPECPVDLWICGHTHSPYRYDPVTGKIYGAGAGRKVSEVDAATIKFPVYVNDGPGGLGVNLSALELVNDKDGIMLIMRDMDSKRVMDHIRIVRGKPIEAISTEFVDTECQCHRCSRRAAAQGCSPVRLQDQHRLRPASGNDRYYP